RTNAEVRFDDGSRAAYSTDGSNYRQVPLGVLLPRSLDDVTEAVELYISLLPGSGSRRVVEYPLTQMPDVGGNVRYEEFRLAGQDFAVAASPAASRLSNQ
ncbi:hypothetical protein, partial [Mucilaginibacter gynuensis]|uniref:hypothetical protein n=1 Tax=Mucilaginibacter gynuensis TaxID=1302236 RepID=UPI0031E68983